MQAITTKYLSPTDTKGPRIKASCDAGSAIIPYPYELSGDDAHASAAMALVRKLGWIPSAKNVYSNFWVCGSLPGMAGCVFVQAESRSRYGYDFGA
ncbi:hypothetical protein [Burkholderia cepacia]|uniref:hypothetical protein n=1 Tax=Burkholderia cepacia TaxID=292 RepID=UPI001CF3B1C8|nr:hypothetical protein [Burkholderia cepacia]MCA8110244.1 hypothetical protein [Burkholderia cepacia]MCA8396543.1 hypothetical protein [Burkholderia cepacia]